MSWAIEINSWERQNGNFQDVGAVPSKLKNEKEKNTMVDTRFACYQKAKHLTQTQLEEI